MNEKIKYQIVLASKSPRRKELLSLLGYPFKILTADTDECYSGLKSPGEIVEALAKRKATAVERKFSLTNSIIIGADTIVVSGETIYGKPVDKSDAYKTLYRLQDNTHQVYTGVCLLTPLGSSIFHTKTDVTFFPMNEDEIWNYIDSGEPMDKAGSYGIQDKGALLVSKLNGDYFSVVGLPISRLSKELKDLLL